MVLFLNAIRNLHQHVVIEKNECFVPLLIVLFKSLDFRKGGLQLGWLNCEIFLSNRQADTGPVPHFILIDVILTEMK